jgi:tetratricopeptide (TPR) repeat protein
MTPLWGMRLLGTLPLACACYLAGSALAEEKLSETENAQQYQACMVLVDKAPSDALESAIAWEKKGGGDAALHCQALSMIGLGQFEDAALMLERIAMTLPQVKAPIAAELFAQAGQAWLRAGKTELALHDQNQGLSLMPDNVDLLVDRAFSYSEGEKYFEALDDLNKAVDLSPDRADLYAYRAAAYIHLENLDLAGDNLAQALKLAPNFPPALLERGRLRKLSGDMNGARADFLLVIELSPAGSEIAKAAQLQLEAIDVKVE